MKVAKKKIPVKPKREGKKIVPPLRAGLRPKKKLLLVEAGKFYKSEKGPIVEIEAIDEEGDAISFPNNQGFKGNWVSNGEPWMKLGNTERIYGRLLREVKRRGK